MNSLASVLLQATLQTLQDFDPDMGHTLMRVLQSGGADLAALLQLEGLSQDTTAEAYVLGAVQRVCVDEVKWQSTNFAQVRFLFCKYSIPSTGSVYAVAGRMGHVRLLLEPYC